MPTPVAHVGAVGMCPHAGPLTFIPTAPRVLVSGMPVVTIADQTMVAGCVFVLAGAPHPCIRVQWIVPAVRVTSGGVPILLQTSVGLCQAPDQAPQGPPVIVSTQPLVLGT